MSQRPSPCLALPDQSTYWVSRCTGHWVGVPGTVPRATSRRDGGGHGHSG